MRRHKNADPSMGWIVNTKRPMMWEPDRKALKGPSRANPALDYAEGWKIAEIGGFGGCHMVTQQAHALGAEGWRNPCTPLSQTPV
ncbi:hypothetical protein TMEN_9090 [Trichophyton mentagrophytes]|nr:hypothetical protein TMEN_9090 [Trichophyton mentagrophytes]